MSEVAQQSAAPETIFDSAAPESAPEQEAASEQPAQSAQEKKIQEEIRKYKLKIDGEEEEVDEKELIARAQKYKSATKRFEEASTIKKQAQQLVELLKSDPLSVLRDPSIGVDVDSFVQKYVEDQIREMELSPEDKKVQELEKELKGIKEQYEKEKSEREQQELQAKEEAYFNQLQDEMVGAIEKSKLPYAPYVAKRVADIMLTALDMNKEITAAKAVQILESSLMSEDRDRFGKMSEDQIEEYLGEELLSRMQKHRLSKVKKQSESPAPKVAAVAKPEPKKEDKSSKTVNTRDFFKLY